MAMENKYIHSSKVFEAKFRQFVRIFSMDLNVTQLAQVAGLNSNTASGLLQGIRERIDLACEAESPAFGEVEFDESYFGARRVKGTRGRGARGKNIVFACSKGRAVFTQKLCRIVIEPPHKTLFGAA